MGLVKRGRPFTHRTGPAPSGTKEQWLVIRASRMDSLPAALPIRVTARHTTLPFSYNDSSVPAILDPEHRSVNPNFEGLWEGPSRHEMVWTYEAPGTENHPSSRTHRRHERRANKYRREEA